VTLGGAMFLLVYGLFAFRRALKPEALEAAEGGGLSWKAALVTLLAFTFLNPHVYLDTVILLGGIASRYSLEERIWFGIGGATASFVFFFSLGYGARLLAPLFAKTVAWRVLDLIIAAVMWALAAMLVLESDLL